MRGTLKRLSAKLDQSNIFERLSAHSILYNRLPEVVSSDIAKTREDLWRDAIRKIGSDKKILLLEFGVFQGYSMNVFCQGFTNPDSRFAGFDSFIGLPEDWNIQKAGTFSTDGRLPTIEDNRVTFVKGWFQNSTRPFLDKVDFDTFDEVLIHFDADLYSSTLYLLSTLAPYVKSYFCIFDEFWGHEARALHNFRQAYGAELEFFGHTRSHEELPIQVFGHIRLAEIYEP